MANLKQYIQLGKHCYKIRLTIHGKSGPGMGKTDATGQMVQELSEEYDEPFGLHTLHLSCMDSIDAEGIRVPTKVVHREKEYLISSTTRSPLLPPLDGPRRGIVFLDEVMQATQDVLKPVARFIHERRIGDHELPPGWSIVCASNRVSDKSGVTRGMSFLTNRQMIVEIAGNLDVWVEWALRKEVHPLIIGFVRFKKGDVFRNEVPEDPDEPFLTPRSIVAAGRVLGEIDDVTLATIGVQGLIGKGASAELMAFVRMADQLPTYEQIVAKPMSTPVPKTPDACYAVTQMLASRVVPKDAVPVFQYLSQLQPEFQVSCLRDAMARPGSSAAAMLSNPEFAKWVKKNSSLVMAANSAG